MLLKIKIEDKEHSKAVQKCLFGLGYTWQLKGDNFNYDNLHFIFADVSHYGSKIISYCTSGVYYDRCKNTEVTLEKLKEMVKENNENS